MAREVREREGSYQKQLADFHRLMRKLAYHQALQAARTALAIRPDDPEALRMIGEAEVGIVRLPEEQRAARKRAFIVSGVVAGICLVAAVAFWNWKKQEGARRVQKEFDRALDENTVHAWRVFESRFPQDARVQQARDSMASIGRAVDANIISAKQILADPNIKTYPDYIRQPLCREADSLLSKALELDSGNADALKVRRLIPVN